MSGVCNHEGLHKGFQCVHELSKFRIEHGDTIRECAVCLEEQAELQGGEDG